MVERVLRMCEVEGWRDGPAVNGAFDSSRRPKLLAPIWGGLQLPVTTAPRDLTCSPGLGILTEMCTYLHTNTFRHTDRQT